MRKMLAVIGLLLGGATGAAANSCEVLHYNLVRATPRVYVFQANEATAAIVNSNIVAVVGRDAILVVDPGQFPSATAKAMAQLKGISAAPVKYVVNTHWHGDHLLANSAVRQAYPQAEFIAHSHTIEESKKRYPADYADKTLKEFEQVVPQFRKRGEESSSADEKAWISATLDCAELVVPEIKVTTPVVATRAVDTELELDLGELAVTVKHVGSGNTPGDLIVYVPSEKLAAIGDMIVYPTPYAIGSDLEPWPATLDKLLAVDATAYVPGHGPVFRDTAYIRDVQALLRSAREQLAGLYAQGVAKQDAGKQVKLDEFRARYITTGMRDQSFRRFFIGAAVERYWTEMEKKKAAAK